MAAAGTPAAVKALREFRGGFDAADGYDLRKIDTWTPQRRAAVTRAAADLGRQLSTPDLRVVNKSRYTAENNEKIASTLARDQSPAYRVHFVNDPTLGNRPIDVSGEGATIGGIDQPETITGKVFGSGDVGELAGTARKLAGQGNPVYLTWSLWGIDFDMLPGYQIDNWNDIAEVQKALTGAIRGLPDNYRRAVKGGGLYAAFTFEGEGEGGDWDEFEGDEEEWEENF